MKLPHRRRFLHLAAGAAALPALPQIARAQAYPSSPVRVIVGFAAAGSPDIAARIMGQWLSERMKQQFVIENRTGAGGNIAAEMVVKAPADGYTLLLLTGSYAVNATLYDKLNYDVVRDFAPVASIVTGTPYLMLVNPTFPAKTVPEFIAYVKQNPGKINFASAGVGSSPHMAAELFKMMAGLNMVHVPYRGGAPAMTDLIGGQVQMYFGTVAASIEYVTAGKLRALGISTATRTEGLPNIPAISEFLPDYEATTWFGIGAPKNTPAEIIGKLHHEISAGLADTKMKAQLADLGSTVPVGSPDDFRRFIASEVEKWGKVVKFAGIKPE